GDRPAELVAHHREHAGDLLAARGPGGGVGGVGVDHAAHLLHVRVDVGMGGGVRGGHEARGGPVVDLLAVEGADHHVLGGQLVARDAGGLALHRPGHSAIGGGNPPAAGPVPAGHQPAGVYFAV